MKIHSLTTGAVGYSRRVREKHDGESQNQNSNSSQQEFQKEDEKNQESDPSFDETIEKKLEQAVEAFQIDSQAQANGLNASLSGTGPGLRITLKDVSGTVVRQLTAEEFLRLREATSNEGQVRGKILDQKL